LKRVARLGVHAAAGAAQFGEAIGLVHNNGAVLRFDVENYVGSLDPLAEAPVKIGAQGEFNQAKAKLTTAQADYSAKVIEGLAFCGKAVSLLQNDFGKRWNGQWEAAGFTAGTLKLPSDPVPLLMEMCAFYRTHPEKELAQINLTANAAATLSASIVAAFVALGVAKAERGEAMIKRDAAARQVQQRLSALQEELSRLLGAEDPRWYKFGFKRPADGNIPDRVEGLVLRTGGIPGEVIAEWESSSLAENYRVTKQVRGVDSEPVVVALVSDTDANVRGLPSGATVVISVTARNSAGETLATEATIVLP
jgi:hypothetical protein